jgi:Protein kinase domain
MNEQLQPDTADSDELIGLFEQYIALRESAGGDGVDALLARAGERADGLRERIHVYGMLRELGELISEDVKEDVDVPRRLGRFEIVRPLGEGGLSRVFLARDPVLERDVAVKVLRPTATLGARDRTWIVSEGRNLAQLEHDSIVRVLDVGELDGQAWFAMEHVQGPSLAEVLEALRRPGVPAAANGAGARAADVARSLRTIAARCRFVLQLARALAYCHARKIVHRDIKPGNVLIDGAGVPKLIDFGLAKLDSDDSSLFVTDRLVGTPAYLAPEQVDKGRTGASQASDQFSLGVVLYELLTLQHPFAQQGRDATMTAISRADPLPPRRLNREIPADLERVCLHCLERHPARRYAAIADLARDLEAFLEHRAISLQAPSLAHQIALLARRHRGPLRAVGIALAAVLGAALVAALWVGRSNRAEVRSWAAERAAGLESLEDPAGFEALFEDIYLHRDRARELDASPLARLVLPETAPDVAALRAAAAQRLAGILEPLYAGAEKIPYYSTRVGQYREIDARWGDALYALRRSAPAGPDAYAFERPDSVELPEGGELLRYDPFGSLPGDRTTAALPGLPQLSEQPTRTDLYAGIYRYTKVIDGELRETEFWIDPSMPCIAPPLRPLAPWLAGRLVQLEGRDIPCGPYGDRSVRAFQISPAPVTWGHVRRVFSDDEIKEVVRVLREDQGFDAFGDEQPAPLPWPYALEYCVRVGARMPTPQEVWVAFRAGALDLGGDPFDAEWIATGFFADERYALLHAQLADKPAPGDWIERHTDIDSDEHVCFRVAITAP